MPPSPATRQPEPAAGQRGGPQRPRPRRLLAARPGRRGGQPRQRSDPARQRRGRQRPHAAGFTPLMQAALPGNVPDHAASDRARGGRRRQDERRGDGGHRRRLRRAGPAVKFLLDHGADVNAKDSAGHTALMGAAFVGQRPPGQAAAGPGGRCRRQDGHGLHAADAGRLLGQRRHRRDAAGQRARTWRPGTTGLHGLDAGRLGGSLGGARSCWNAARMSASKTAKTRPPSGGPCATTTTMSPPCSARPARRSRTTRRTSPRPTRPCPS